MKRALIIGGLLGLAAVVLVEGTWLVVIGLLGGLEDSEPGPMPRPPLGPSQEWLP